MSSLQATIERIRNLESQKKSLLIEIDELRRLADAKATSLENEVATLREEARTLRALMGAQQPTATVTPSIKMG